MKELNRDNNKYNHPNRIYLIGNRNMFLSFTAIGTSSWDITCTVKSKKAANSDFQWD
ncbi:hypothetical protein J23TS9_13210 [Paenibacillus sp. J23TS9]|nr:hypothetical protein J23TS9_13210 [Paenibacillus sp. J23TS9]